MKVMRGLVLLGCGSLLICACADSTGASSARSMQPAERTVAQSQTADGVRPGMDASWAQSFKDVSSLKRASDLVVSGQVSAKVGQATSDGIPFTDFAFTVQAVVYDPRWVAPHSVILHQTGGAAGGQVLEIADDPLFVVGERAVLFLRQYAPGHYYVIGGPNGRFEVNGTRIVPADPHGVQPRSDDLAAFLREIAGS